ncbi:MAG: hypothetical protein ACOH2L_16585 [Devosia sp.]
MTLADLTALYSTVMRERKDLQGDRNVELFIQACIEEQRRQDARRRPERAGDRPPLAPVDLDTY